MVTAFSIATIAIDRWQFITASGKDRSTNLSTFLCILLIWILALIISLPSYIVNDLKFVKLVETNETLYKVKNIAILIMLFLIIELLLVLLITFFWPFLK